MSLYNTGFATFFPTPRGGGRGIADGGHRVAGVATAVAQRWGFVEWQKTQDVSKGKVRYPWESTRAISWWAFWWSFHLVLLPYPYININWSQAPPSTVEAKKALRRGLYEEPFLRSWRRKKVASRWTAGRRRRHWCLRTRRDSSPVRSL